MHEDNDFRLWAWTFCRSSAPTGDASEIIGAMLAAQYEAAEWELPSELGGLLARLDAAEQGSGSATRVARQPPRPGVPRHQSSPPEPLEGVACHRVGLLVR
jgi:hypothetical protein